jgi:hypothetical protein
MNYKFFPFAIKNMFLHPGKAWDIINSEDISTSELRNGFLIPVIFLISASAFGGSIMFVNSKLAPSYSLMEAAKCFIVTYIAIYGTARILIEVTSRLELGRDFNVSFRLVVFSSVPFLTCQFLSRFFESLLFINILAFFGLYVFWVGVEKLLNPPQKMKMPLLIATTVIMLIIYIVSNVVLSKIIDKVYYSLFA